MWPQGSCVFVNNPVSHFACLCICEGVCVSNESVVSSPYDIMIS